MVRGCRLGRLEGTASGEWCLLPSTVGGGRLLCVVAGPAVFVWGALTLTKADLLAKFNFP